MVGIFWEEIVIFTVYILQQGSLLYSQYDNTFFSYTLFLQVSNSYYCLQRKSLISFHIDAVLTLSIEIISSMFVATRQKDNTPAKVRVTAWH